MLVVLYLWQFAHHYLQLHAFQSGCVDGSFFRSFWYHRGYHPGARGAVGEKFVLHACLVTLPSGTWSYPGRRGSRTWWPSSTVKGFTSVPVVTSGLGRSCGSGTVRITWSGCIACPRRPSTEISQQVSPALSALFPVPVVHHPCCTMCSGWSRWCPGCARRLAFLQAAHVLARASSSAMNACRRMMLPLSWRSWNNYLCCVVLCCVVLCCIVFVLLELDTVPREHRAPSSQDFVTWDLQSWWSHSLSLGFSLTMLLSLALVRELWLVLCVYIREISLVCLYVHFPGLIYLLFLQKDNVGSARHQLETP